MHVLWLGSYRPFWKSSWSGCRCCHGWRSYRCQDIEVYHWTLHRPNCSGIASTWNSHKCYKHLSCMLAFFIQIDSDVIPQWAAGECQNCTLLLKTCENDAGEEFKCKYFFNLFEISDLVCGIILVCISLIVLCGSLLVMVKTLNSLLQGNERTNEMIENYTR